MKASAAGASALRWDEPAATAFNGQLPAAEPAKVCGADDRRFLGELLEGDPLGYKIPERLADIKASPSSVLVSGTVEAPTLGAGDFPFDHTMGSDFNMDVHLDQPFLGVGQEDAKQIDSVHVELAAGQLPHLVTAPAPAQRDWRDMTEAAREHLQDGFVPRSGDRVLVMGHWIVDCGHTSFQTEMHPITFMAVARTEGAATVVHTFYNPWRETQLYNADPAKTVDFSRPDRVADPTNVPFPKGLIDSILRIQNAGPAPFTSADRLSSWAVLEPNTSSPVKWQVCAPGASGTAEVGASLVTQPGASVHVAPGINGCATVSTTINGVTPAAPGSKTCTTPWAFLSKVATAEARGEERKQPEGGGPAENTTPQAEIDLKAQLGEFVAPQYRSRLDNDPVMNCYDALSGPDLGGSRPTEVDVHADPTALMPFYGTIVVRRRT